MATKRASIGNKKRFDVFKRDLFKCQYCGSVPPKVILEIDHITPVSKGGTNHIDNLVTSCFNCNRGKRDHLLTSVPQSLADKAKEVKELEAQLKGYKNVMQEKMDRIEYDAWRIADTIFPDCSKNGFNQSWLNSIKLFLDKLDYFSIIEAAQIANSKYFKSDYKTFKYFCAICWNKIKGE